MFCAAVLVGLTMQREVLRHTQSFDWWVHVVLQTFDNESWHANFQTCCGTFVRICGHLAPCLVHQNTLFRCSISAKWCKRHSDICFEWAEHPEWRYICKNRIWIAFQTTWPCGLDLICKSQISDLNQNKINMDTIGICQKSDLGW